MCPRDPKPVKQSRSVGKKIIGSVFPKSGSFEPIAQENQLTVNTRWCVNICLPKLFENFSLRCLRSEIALHYDNILFRTAQRTNHIFIN
jgi:hypothetical protein